MERGKNFLYQKNITNQTPQHSGTNFEPHIQNNSPSLVSFHGFCGYEFWLVVLGNCRTPHFQKLIYIYTYVNSHIRQSFFSNTYGGYCRPLDAKIDGDDEKKGEQEYNILDCIISFSLSSHLSCRTRMTTRQETYIYIYIISFLPL